MKQNLLKNTLISAAVAATIGLTGCGGSSGGSEDPTPPVTLSGKVADGYLVGATVCLDLNINQQCDIGEPSATSTTGGNYSFEATQAQIDTYPVVVKVIKDQTIDEDTGTAVTQAYTLSAPAGRGEFVSPLTTLVQAQVDATGGDVDAIASQILTSMGQDPAAVSLFNDYVAAGNDVTDPDQASYERMHQVAQVTAVQIADNLALIETEIANATIDIDLTTALDSVINRIAELVIAQLAAIDTAIDAEVVAGTYDPASVAATVDVTVDTGTIQAYVDAGEAIDNATTSAIQALFESGIYWMYGEFNSGWAEMEYGSVIASGTTLTDTYYSWNFQTEAWDLVMPGLDEYILQANGSWLGSNDDWSNASISYNTTAQTATISGDRGNEVFENVQEVDWSGLNIKTTVEAISPDLALVLDPTAVFNTGAKSYTGTIRFASDVYQLGFWDECTAIDPQYTASGNCNTMVDWSGATPVQLTSLADLLSATAWDGFSSPKFYWLGGDNVSSLQYELVGTGATGTVNYYLQENCDTACTWTIVDTGSWNLVTVNGTSLLMVDHPVALMEVYSTIINQNPAENSFFAIHESVVRQGWHTPAGFTETLSDGDAITNEQAQIDILAAIDPVLLSAQVATSTPLPEPTAGLTCGFESVWDDLADGGLGAPITAHSFDEYEALLADCGTAVAFTAADVAGSVFIDGGGEINTFNNTGTAGTVLDPGTGTYEDGAGTVIAFEWYVEAATCAGCTHSYVVTYSDQAIAANLPAGFWFRGTAALYGVTGTPGVSGSVYSFYHYDEQSNYSDGDRATGADGDIWQNGDILQ